MKRLLTLSCLLLALVLLPLLGLNQTPFVVAQEASAPQAQLNGTTSDADVPDTPDTPDIPDTPVMFIKNVGQFDEDARFKVHGSDVSLWLADDALWITLLEAPIELGFVEKNAPEGRSGGTNPPTHRPTNPPGKGVNLKLSFVDANPQPEIEPFDLLETKMNYFLGHDSDKWRSNVPVYGGVRYKEIYPGIDLELTSQNGQMVQRLVASEEADLDAVRLRVEGADGMQLLTNGTNNDVTGLRVSTAIGDVTLALFTLVTPNGSTDAATLNGNQILAPFAPDNPDNQARALAPDGTLTYSTFIGSTSDDRGYELALDSAGNAVVTGKTSSSNFPTMPGSYDTTYHAGSDAFVLKLNSKGNALLYSTFIGGGADDAGYSLTLDSAGNAYVTGATYSSDFPTYQGYDIRHNGNQDVFVLSLNAAGNSLHYSTFVGGSSEDVGTSLSLDSAGNIYVTGWTESADFPARGGYDTSYNGNRDVFVFKLNSQRLIYSTFLGGEQYDYGSELVLDNTGHVILTGNTQSPDFPITGGSYNAVLGGLSDIFVLRLNQAGNAVRYSTFIGGSDYDFGCGLALDNNGNVVVTGGTSSDNFPTTPGSYDTSHNGFTDSFVLQLSSGGNTLRYSTVIGGTSSEYSCELALDSAGNAIVTGVTSSSGFPTTPDGYDTIYNGNQDTFVIQLSEAGNALLYSTFLGGTNAEIGNGLALDHADNIVVTGYTESENFPTTTDSYDSYYNGSSDVFVSKMNVVGGVEVPLFLQTSQPWRNDPYGRYPDGDTINTINKWGCFMTSAAMIINYWGQQNQIPFQTNPRDFNTWLRTNSGYDPGNLVRWIKISEYASQNNVSLSIHDRISGRNDDKLDSLLDSGKLAILGVNSEGHYVLATSKTTVNGQSTYAINDPIYGQTTLYEHYNNNYSSILPFSNTSGNQGMLTISAHSPVHLLVTDVLGRKSGYDPATGVWWDEIPDAEYFVSTLAPDGGSGQDNEVLESKVLQMLEPEDGQYTIQVLGTGKGSYQLLSTASNSSGQITEVTISGQADVGSIETVDMTYSSQTGVANQRLFIPTILK